MAIPLASATPRTQKAQGLKVLHTISGIHTMSDVQVIQQPDHLLLPSYPSPFPKFARPCPIRPRAGFVDSRIVKSSAELATVWEETLAADPKGEVLLMTPITAKWSACVLPGLLSIGPGHDGATAGKHAIGVPLLGNIPGELTVHLPQLNLGRGEVPHVEVVHGTHAGSYGDLTYWVQARSGPAVEAGAVDYVPASMEVLQVIKPCDDLLEWEAQVKTLAPGTVVHAPGATLASHAAIHCIAAGVPFLTSRTPKVGEVLQPILRTGWDLASVVEGIGAALLQKNDPSISLFPYTQMVLYGLHHAPALSGRSAFYLGYAAGLMLKLGMLAAENEMCLMHDYPSTPQAANHAALWFTPSKFSHYHAHLQSMTEEFFLQMNSSGCGGINWGRCSYATLKLDIALQQVIKAWEAKLQGVHELNQLVITLNKAIDQAHNGGFWMNKFGCQVTHFTQASDGYWGPVISACPVIYAAEKARTPRLIARCRAMARVFAHLKPLVEPSFKCKLQMANGQTHIVYANRHGTGENPTGRIALPNCPIDAPVTHTVKGTCHTITAGKWYSQSFELEQDHRKTPAQRAAKVG